MPAFEAQCSWTHQKRSFELNIRDHHLRIDTKKTSGGDDSGPSPKELVLAGIIGCTGIDAVSILEKMRQPLVDLKISSQAEKAAGELGVFGEVTLQYFFTGSELDASKVKRAVDLSMTKYCGVSAMIAEIAPIKYEIFLNGNSLGQGQAHFAEMALKRK